MDKGAKDQVLELEHYATKVVVVCDEQRKDPRSQKEQKEMDIQQLKFAGGHPPNYYAAGKLLKYARADGMACSQLPVVVCDRICFCSAYIA